MYTKTLDLLHERARLRGKSDPDDYVFTMRRQAMAVGIGFGWVNYTRGFLRRAENALVAARAMLAGSSDPVVPFYINLLYGTIRRCRAGNDPAGLAEAIKILDGARAEFERNGHRRYVARACWELSLSHNLLGDDKTAEKYLDIVEKEAERTGHPKWRTNVSILWSRILRKRGDFQGALEKAELALERARDCKSILPEVDAYLTLGEAKFDEAEHSSRRDGYDAACGEFKKALRLALTQGRAGTSVDLPSNPKIVAVCHLRIAQCYAREGDEAKAKEYFAEWGGLRPNVEHQWVRDLAARVESEIEGLRKNFNIPADDESEWNYARNVARLRQWLLEQALLTKKNYSDAAGVLGVKRATLYQWKDESRGPSKRARVNVAAHKPQKKNGKED
jgi:tetratricopeptide (TPR) repeat protein